MSGIAIFKIKKFSIFEKFSMSVGYVGSTPTKQEVLPPGTYLIFLCLPPY